LRHMNAVYAERMTAAVSALNRHCGKHLAIGDGGGGQQLPSWFRDVTVNDLAAMRFINSNGFALRAMSSLHLGPSRPGLLFGIARME
ncbi:PLP-dependent aminotransferase family protein, partial [Rhizobium brockwellii]